MFSNRRPFLIFVIISYMYEPIFSSFKFFWLWFTISAYRPSLLINLSLILSLVFLSRPLPLTFPLVLHLTIPLNIQLALSPHILTLSPSHLPSLSFHRALPHLSISCKSCAARSLARRAASNSGTEPAAAREPVIFFRQQSSLSLLESGVGA